MVSHSWPFRGYLYPPIVKHGLLENPPFISLIFPALNFKLPFIGIVNCHVWCMTHIPSNVHSYPTSINYYMPLSYPIWENKHISLTWIVAATKGDDFPNITMIPGFGRTGFSLGHGRPDASPTAVAAARKFFPPAIQVENQQNLRIHWDIGKISGDITNKYQ